MTATKNKKLTADCPDSVCHGDASDPNVRFVQRRNVLRAHLRDGTPRAVVANAYTYARTLALADGVPLGLVDGLRLDPPATPEARERERELLQAHGWRQGGAG